jgi:hypothetical protein
VRFSLIPKLWTFEISIAPFALSVHIGFCQDSTQWKGLKASWIALPLVMRLTMESHVRVVTGAMARRFVNFPNNVRAQMYAMTAGHWSSVRTMRLHNK